MMQRMPVMRSAGIKRIVNGGMVFSPDGNPIIGPLPGLDTAFVAAGCMAGFSQGGGIGLAVARWIVDGEPGMDVFAMDVSRFGDFANAAYVRSKTRENYQRRFILPCWNEELPAARPLRTSPIYDRLADAGAVFGVSAAYEVPLWFAGSREAAHETPSFHRSSAFEPVAEECRAVREAVGLWETSSYCKLEIAGPGAAAWLDGVLANRLPSETGRIALSPMLTPHGRHPRRGHGGAARAGSIPAVRLPQRRGACTCAGCGSARRRRRVHDPQPHARAVRTQRDRTACPRAARTGDDGATCPIRACRSSAFAEPHRWVLRTRWCCACRSPASSATRSTWPPTSNGMFTRPLCEAGAALGLAQLRSAGAQCAAAREGLRRLGTRIFRGCDARRGRSLAIRPRRQGTFRRTRGRDRGAQQSAEAAADAARDRLVDPDPVGGEPVFVNGEPVARLTSAAFAPGIGQALGFAYLPAELEPRADIRGAGIVAAAAGACVDRGAL